MTSYKSSGTLTTTTKAGYGPARELTVDATIPTGTSVDATVYQDDSGGSTADAQQTVALSDGTNTYSLSGFGTSTSAGFWLEFALSANSAGDATPSINSATLTVEVVEPSGLTVTNTGADTVDLEFVDESAVETEFHLYRSTSSGVTTADTLAATVSSSSTSGTGSTYSVTDSGRTQDTTYYYVATAYDGSNESPLSAEVSGTTNQIVESGTSNEASGTTVLPAPSGLAVTAHGATSISVEATDNASNEDGFRWEYSTDGGATWSEHGATAASTGTGGTITYTYNNLRNGEQYDLRVRAYTEDTDSTPSNTATQTTDLPNASQPTLGNGVEDEIAVSWTDVINNGEYDLEYRETGASTWLNGPTVDEAITSATITGLEDGEEYEVRLRTQTGHVTGSWTSPTSIVTKFPGATGLSTSNVTQTSVGLAWSDNSDNEDGFRPQRREKVFDGSWTSWQEIADLAANTTTFTDALAHPDTTYEYRIEAYTEHTSALSNTTQTTTVDDGVRAESVTATDWHVIVEAPDGTLHTPEVTGRPVRNPKLNDYPQVRVPVPKADKWDRKWVKRAPMRVYKDGNRLPIDQVKRVEQTESNHVIIGWGGKELRQRVSIDVLEEDAHVTARNATQNNTTYATNFDDPQSTTSADVLQQEVDTQSSWESALVQAYSASDVVDVDGTGHLRTRQTAYFAEAEAGNYQNGSEVIEQDSSRWSGGKVIRFDQSGLTTYLETTHVTDHDIPAGSVGIEYRMQVQGDGHPGFGIEIDGSTVESISADVLASGETEPDWNSTGMLQWDQSLSAGEHTVRINFDEPSSANDPVVYVDCTCLYDERHSPGFTENVSGGVIEGPDEYPGGIQVETDDVATVRQVVGAKLTSSWNSLTNSAQVAISNDSGGTWLTADNSDTVEGSFASSSGTIRARFTIGGFDTNPSTSPAGRTAPHKVDLYSLYADLDDTPLLVNRSWDTSLKEVLNDVADYGNFIWELRWDSTNGMTVEWTQAGQRTADIDPALVSYDTSRNFAKIHRKAIIYGTSVPEEGESFTSNYDTWVSLNNDWLQETGERVYDPSSETTYDRGADYELKPNTGEIKVLSTGAMSDSTGYEISYQRKIRGTYTSGAYDGTYAEFVDTLPAITTERNAEQAALILTSKLADPVETATVRVDKEAGYRLTDALSIAALPGDDPLETWSIEDKPGEIVLRLGDRAPVQEEIQRLQSQLAAVKRKT